MSRQDVKRMLDNWEEHDINELTDDHVEYTKFRESKQTKKKKGFEQLRKRKQKERESLLGEDDD